MNEWQTKRLTHKVLSVKQRMCASFVLWKWIVIIFILFTTTRGQIILRANEKTSTIKLETGIQFVYDDNIFLYSARDLADFKKSIRPYRFPFETSDDFITTIKFRIQYSKFGIGRYGSLTMSYRHHFYTVNRIKSYQVFSMAWAQKLSKTSLSNFEIGYLFLPKYLIRFYRDPENLSLNYIGCEFTEHLFSVEFNYRKRYALLTPFYKYEFDDYTNKFNYYDTKAHRFGLNAIYHWKRMFELSGGLEYKVAKTQPNQVPDISYEQLGWVLEVGIGQVPKISVAYGEKLREFTTKNPATIDPFHAGRVDKIQRIKLELAILLSKVISLTCFYDFESRNVSSPYKEKIDEIKDYHNNRIGLSLKLRRF